MVRALTCVFIKDIHERKCHCLACQQHMTYLGEKGRNTVKNTNLTVNVKETFRKQQVVCKIKKEIENIVQPKCVESIYKTGTDYTCVLFFAAV